MPEAYTKVWLKGEDGEHNQHCPADYTNDCGGWIWHSDRVARTSRGKQTRARCAKICGSHIVYSSTGQGDPCEGASGRKMLNPSEGLADGAPAALSCTFDGIDGAKLVAMSGKDHQVNSTIKDQGGVYRSVYDQLLFNTRVGSRTTTGFCENAGNLQTVVDKNGDTCYKKLLGRVGEALAKQKAIDFCAVNPNDPKCKCINVAGSGFVERCRASPSIPGCAEVLAGIADFEKAGLQSATGLFGNADCIVPGVCSGDVYQPLSGISSCANKTAICNQAMNLDNVSAAGGVKALQSCNINFEEVQQKKEAAKAAEAKAIADKAAADAKAAADKAASDKAIADKAAADAKAAADKAASDRAAAEAKVAAAKEAGDKAALDRAAAEAKAAAAREAGDMEAAAAAEAEAKAAEAALATANADVAATEAEQETAAETAESAAAPDPAAVKAAETASEEPIEGAPIKKEYYKYIWWGVAAFVIIVLIIMMMSRPPA